MITYPTRLYLPRPSYGHGDTQTSLVKIAFSATKLDSGFRVLICTMNATGMFRGSEIVITSIIPAEKNNSVLIKL